MLHQGDHRSLVRGLALAAAAIAGGCGVLSRSPRIDVEYLSLSSVGEQGMEADLVVRISGGGPQATILTDFEYSVFIDGRRAYRGRWAALAAAPPEESILRSLPVVIPEPMLPDAATAGDPLDLPWSVSGTVGWEDPDRLARILLDLGFATPRANFSGRGGTIEPIAVDPSTPARPGGFEAIDRPVDR